MRHRPGSQSCCPVIGFCPFDLIVYYLPANSFIFNLFLWPTAMDSDTVFFFSHQSSSYLAMNNLELFLGPVLSVLDQSLQCKTYSGQEASQPIIMLFYHFLHFAAILQWPFFSLGTVRMVQTRSRSHCLRNWWERRAT